MSSTVLLSGGFDSTTALASLHHTGLAVEALFVDLGQPAREEERRSSRAIADYYGARHRELTVGPLEIPPEGEINGRNALLIMLALSAVRPPATVSLAVHSGSGYWDCGPEFIALAQELANGYFGGGVQIDAPFAALTKSDVYALGRELGVPEPLTYSCERGGEPCGHCRSCLDVAAHARA